MKEVVPQNPVLVRILELANPRNPTGARIIDAVSEPTPLGLSRYRFDLFERGRVVETVEVEWNQTELKQGLADINGYLVHGGVSS